jgi:hypothetical protein
MTEIESRPPLGADAGLAAPIRIFQMSEVVTMGHSYPASTSALWEVTAGITPATNHVPFVLHSGCAMKPAAP